MDSTFDQTRLAWSLRRYGFSIKNCIHLIELPLPILNPDDVRVKIVAAGLNPVDYKIIFGMALPFFRPKLPFVLGYDFAGIVTEVGTHVSSVKKGDAVYGKVPWDQIGTLTTSSCVHQSMLAIAPSSISLEASSGLPLVACTGMEAFDFAQVKSNSRVFIIGGSGGIGSFLIQYAKQYNCHVTATASFPKIEDVKQLGADCVVDYTSKKDMQQLANFDVVFDTVGGRYPIRSVKWLKTGGKCITLAGHHDQQTLKNLNIPFVFRFALLVKELPLMIRMHQKKIVFKHVWSYPNKERLALLSHLVDQGTIKPVIDRVYPFEQAIAALQYVRTNRAFGKVIVSCIPKNESVDEET